MERREDDRFRRRPPPGKRRANRYASQAADWPVVKARNSEGSAREGERYDIQHQDGSRSVAVPASAISALGSVGRGPVSRELSFGQDIYRGFAISGACGCALTHLTVVPLDVVKTRIQAGRQTFRSKTQEVENKK